MVYVMNFRFNNKSAIQKYEIMEEDAKTNLSGVPGFDKARVEYFICGDVGYWFYDEAYTNRNALICRKLSRAMAFLEAAKNLIEG